jgi:SAM-dependent methyltransferase
MEPTRISAVAHADHPVMAPVSDPSVERMLRTLPIPDGGTVADFGCGRGEWLIRLLQQRGDVTGTGIDVSDVALSAARQTASSAGVGDRATWRLGDATAELGAATDAALCIGAAHAFGGLEPTLSTLGRRVRPGGCVLLGEGFWEHTPSPRALEVIGELPDLAGLVAACQTHHWQVVDGHVSTAEEWDRYEWSWVGSLTRWALDHHGSEDGTAALEAARVHLDEWLTGYRGQLGFATLVLRRPA